MLEQFFAFCSKVAPSLILTDEMKHDLESAAVRKVYKKGTDLISEGEYCTKVFFVERGLLKNGYWKEEREFIVRFCEENIIATDLESIYMKTPSKSFLTAIEDSQVLYLHYTTMDQLLKKHHHLERIARLYHERTLAKTIAWNKGILGFEAKEIYLKFVEENPLLYKRISLGDLSSYLGISQVTLSRIRTSLDEQNGVKV